MRRIAITVLFFLIAGCSTTGNMPVPISDEPIPPTPNQIGLAKIEPQSDVANLTDAVRHVLNPSDVYGSYANVAGTNHRTRPVSTVTMTSTPIRMDEPVSIAQLQRQRDPVYEAWRKYCDRAEEITQAEWALIDSTSMPAELAAIWADECVPLK